MSNDADPREPTETPDGGMKFASCAQVRFALVERASLAFVRDQSPEAFSYGE